MKTAFITGINGFTGKHLTNWLKQQKIRVTGIDLNKSEFYQADLKEKNILEKIISKESPDYVFHLASPLIRSNKLVDQALEKNLLVDLFGTVNLIEAAAKLKKKPKMLITGTAAEYDTAINRARRETDLLKPNSSYGLSKMTQELISRQLSKSYGLQLVYTRSFLLIGPGQAPGFVISDWCRQLRERSPLLKTGDLNIQRDFTDVTDAVKAYWLLINKGKSGEVYNVCSGNQVKLGKILNILEKIAGYDFKIKEDKTKFKNNDPKKLWGDNRKLMALGWKRQITLEQSLKIILENIE